MSVLELLRKRTKAREMSAHDHVIECVRLEAQGKSKGIDVARLEASMLEIGMTFSEFEQAVAREQRLTELREVAAGLAGARDRFKELSAHAKTRRSEIEQEIVVLRQEAENAEQAANAARNELDRCNQAEADLRRLLESPARKQTRIEAKPTLAKLRQQQRNLKREIIYLEGAIDNVGTRTFTFHEQRDDWLAGRQKKLDQVRSKLATVVAQLAQAEAVEKEAAQELDREVAAG